MSSDRHQQEATDAGGVGRRLDDFLGSIDRPALTRVVSEATGTTPEVARRRIDAYLNEAWVALDLVAPHLDGVDRILEVGAGIGAFSTFLASEGYDVLAIEPSAMGFGFMDAARRALDDQCLHERRTMLSVPAEQLTAAHGSFDLAFSVHVLEHVTDIRSSLRAIHERLAERNGRSVHICPNYTLPYEPHFGIPLVPHRPELTGRLLPRRMVDSDLWASLNFVTAHEITEIASELGLEVHFRSGVMADMARRVRRDPTFRSRHGRAVQLMGWLVESAAGSQLLERWPPALATPMCFTVDRGSQREVGTTDGSPIGR